MRGLFVKNPPRVDVSEEEIFPEIGLIDKEFKELEDKSEVLEKEEEKKDLSPGAKGLLFYRNVAMFKERQEKLAAHLERVKGLEKVGK